MRSALRSVAQDDQLPIAIHVEGPTWTCVGWRRKAASVAPHDRRGGVCGQWYVKLFREEASGRVVAGGIEHGRSVSPHTRDTAALEWWNGTRAYDLGAELFGRERGVRP